MKRKASENDRAKAKSAISRQVRRSMLPESLPTMPPEQIDPSRTDGVPPQPAAEAISRRAYELYLERGGERGGEHGSDVDDWLQAERELAGRAKGDAPIDG